MNKVEGLHHLAICTANMKEQIEFFTDKLGMELQALYWMHGVENTWHGFLRLNDESSIAFVCNPDIEKIQVELGQSHAGNPVLPCRCPDTDCYFKYYEGWPRSWWYPSRSI